MKIACVSTSRIPSSTANSIQVMKACHALAALGHEVRLWVPGEARAGWTELSEYYGLSTPFEICWLPAQAFWRRYDFSMAAMREAKHWGAALFYTWLLPAAVLALWQGMPAVLELHDVVTGRIGPQSFKMFCSHKKNKKRLMVITEALKEKLETQFGIKLSENEVLIAPNGTDLERYRTLPDPSTARNQLGLPEMPTAVYSGHFYTGRGVDVLFGLARGCPHVHFLWVGGNEKSVAEWNVRLNEMGIRNVTLTGFVPNSRLPLYQAAGEVLLMPYDRSIAGSSGGNSADICSPMKMFDYLACGRVILSSDLPVIHEVLTTDNAIFCQPENVENWVETLQDVIDHPEKQIGLALQARNDAVQYSWIKRAQNALEGF